MHYLIALGLRCPEHSTPRRLAEGTLQLGDPAGVDMWWDCLIDEGLGMFELQMGKAYLISTVTFYYLGRVKSSSLTSVVLGERAQKIGSFQSIWS